MFLVEPDGAASKAVLGCGASPGDVIKLVEEEILAKKTLEQLKKGFLGASDLLLVASLIAKDLDQELNGAHFLLAALKHPETAMAHALNDYGTSLEVLRAWMESDPSLPLGEAEK